MRPFCLAAGSKDCDLLIELPNHVYAFEIKLDRSTEGALTQVRERGYLEPYADDPRRKLAVALVVGKAAKRITDWSVEVAG